MAGSIRARTPRQHLKNPREGFEVHKLLSTVVEKDAKSFAASLLHGVMSEKSQGLPGKCVVFAAEKPALLKSVGVL